MRTTRPLTQEELEALSKDLQEVLIKHNAEMGVTSTINLMYVQDEPATETEAEEVKSDGEATTSS